MKYRDLILFIVSLAFILSLAFSLGVNPDFWPLPVILLASIIVVIYSLWIK